MSALTTDAAAGALVQAASDPMWALDAELRLTAFNEAFAELVRAAWGAEPALGLAVDALPERVAGRHRAAYQRALKGERFRFDWSVDPIDAIWSVELAPIVEEGRTRGVTAIARDVSERKRLHQELLAAQASAERANQAQSEFLAMVSHELRTPLNAIVGLTRVAAEGPVDGQQSLLARVEQNASHLLHLVTDLLDFSRIDGGLLELRPVPASFRRMVEQEVEAVRPAVERRGLELNVQLDASLPRQVMVDRERVRQIIENLLTNAVRYTHHGRISIEATWIEPKDGETMIQLTVRDTGIGIAKAEQKLIFTRFYRSTRSASGRAEGTGLGLAITKAVVDRMGGQIRLRSQPGQGSVFSIRLPAERVHPRTEEPLPARVARQAHILVAEDNPDNLRITRMLLERGGDRVACATDGQAALDACAATDFDLVVMDVDMAPMDGIRATTELRAREELLGLRRVPIVALTAHAVPEIRRRCEEAGMDGFLTKPVDEDRLASMVDRLLERAVPAPARAAAPVRVIDPDIADLVPEFLAQRRLDLQELHRALDRGDRDWIRRKAHQIRGSGTSYGYPELTELGGTLERSAAQGAVEELRALLVQMDEVLA